MDKINHFGTGFPGSDNNGIAAIIVSIVVETRAFRKFKFKCSVMLRRGD